MSKLLLAALVLLVAQGCISAVNGESVKSTHKRALLADALDYDNEYAASGPSGSVVSNSPPPPAAKLAEVAASNTTNHTVSKNASIPAVRSVIAFSGFATVAAFDTTAQNNYKTAIVDALASAGYNVAVTIDNVALGSIVVTSTTAFLDGSTTGAAAFTAALGDSNSVTALFPASTYGTVTVKAVTPVSVSNPSSGAGQVGMGAMAAALAALTFGALVL